MVLVLQSWEVLNLPFYTPKIMRLCCFTKWPLKLQVLICTYCHSYCRYKRRLILSECQEDNTLKHTKPVMVNDHKLIQRQKQIDIGKNTLSYGRYIEAVKRYWLHNTQLTSTLILLIHGPGVENQPRFHNWSAKIVLLWTTLTHLPQEIILAWMN